MSNILDKIPHEEGIVNIKGININYVKIGTGEHVLLFMTGVMGLPWRQFKYQIAYLSKTDFTMILWDAPGYGKSRPPDRVFTDDFIERDATFAHDLMKILGYEKFSVMGWCNGGTASLILAHKYPESVRKIILQSAHAYVSAIDVENFTRLRNINNISSSLTKEVVLYYGESYYRKTWSAFADFVIKTYNNNGNLCTEILSDVKCPTLIVQGTNDYLLSPEHAYYLHERIPNSKMKIFEDGNHTVHIDHYEECNKLFTEFLLE